MESLSTYLLNQPKIKDRLFISNPPNAALLLWSSADELPNISGVCIVEMDNISDTEQLGIKTNVLLEIFKNCNKNALPFKHIIYPADLSYMIIDGKKMTLSDAATEISTDFKVKIGRTPAKVPNDVTQISDPFHVWSRDAFDGYSVMKTDIDILTLNEAQTEIKSIIEVKRSKKVPVGKWLPFVNPNSPNNDCNNFYLLMSFAKSFGVNLFTIHHELMEKTDVMIDSHKIDVFTKKHNEIETINQNLLNDYASVNNRNTLTIKDFIGE